MSVRLEHVTKTFDKTIAVDDVTFNVTGGEMVSILGPSGCGKTTVLRIVAGLEQQDGGAVYIDDRQIDRTPTQNRNVGFVFQTYSLFRYMSALDNVEFGLKIRKVPKRKRRKKAQELLELVGLAGFEDRLPRMLSGGQCQRVSLARALAYDPSTLLLDEPFGSLDAKIRKRLAVDLKKIQRELGITTLFVTHDQSEAFELGDRVIIMNRGKIEQIGTPEEIYDHPETKFVASFVGMVNVLNGVISDKQVKVGSLRLDTGTMATSVPYGQDQEVAVLIRPEDIDVRKQQEPGLHRGQITDIRFLGSFVEFEIESGGISFKAVESKGKLHKNGIHLGDEVWVSLKSTKLFSLGEDVVNMRERLRILGYIE
jgi:sulfate transport system ATP-binding protein